MQIYTVNYMCDVKLACTFMIANLWKISVKVFYFLYFLVDETFCCCKLNVVFTR